MSETTIVFIILWLIYGILSIAADSETEIEELRREIRRIENKKL